jgi:glycosyltransferase involved in cell wall biosynthesis
VSEQDRPRIGVVAIGRNEGSRLERCLSSLAQEGLDVVYVDSGSTDDSIALARRFGATVVALDMSKPFTAARARNAGYHALRAQVPAIEFVQFVDGDCAVAPGWLDAASAFLRENANVVAVCGRRRELFPDASVFNELCDIEWDTPVGPCRACGGDAMYRAVALDEVGGFDPTLIAGEEPELCIRLRQRGGAIHRLGHDMTFHDAAMHHFHQWWRRAVRAGHAYAEGARMNGAPPERHYVPQLKRAVFWGGCVPLTIAVGFVPTLGLSSLLAAGYGVSAVRGFRSVRRRGRTVRSAALFGLFGTLAKFAELQGVLSYARRRWSGEASQLIEYK